MSALAKLEERIAAMEAAADDLRQATADAHAAIKDLRTVQREIRDLLSTEVRSLVDKAVEGQVAAGLAEYQATLTVAIERTDKAIERRFERLAKIYLEGTGRGPSLHDQAVAARNRRRAL